MGIKMLSPINCFGIISMSKLKLINNLKILSKFSSKAISKNAELNYMTKITCYFKKLFFLFFSLTRYKF